MIMLSRQLSSPVALLLALSLMGSAAWAQNKKPTRPAGQTSKPAAAKSNEPEVGPYIVQDSPKDWNLTITATVFSDRPDHSVQHRDANRNRTAKLPKVTPFEFETLSMIFPFIPTTSSSQTTALVPGSTGPNASGYRGELRFDDTVVDTEPMMLKGYPNGTQLARWDGGERGKVSQTRQVQLRVVVPVRSWKVTFKEDEALKLGWPKTWPSEAQSALQKQLFVEDGINEQGKVEKYDDADLDKALTAWKKEWGITDFTSRPPVVIAKLITAKVWGMVQINGDGLTFRPRTGELSGIALRSPAEVLRQGRATEHEAPILLAALFRKAGLPTRTVIAYDIGDRDEKFLSADLDPKKIRSYVEFCLFDDVANQINWVPVDLVMLRNSSSRAQSVERRWRYFGTNDELQNVIPFAFHFHPPTDVVSYGSPGFWGWFVSPTAPAQAEQSIQVQAATQSKRNDRQDRKPKKY
jgi:hypothetical protein